LLKENGDAGELDILIHAVDILLDSITGSLNQDTRLLYLGSVTMNYLSENEEGFTHVHVHCDKTRNPESLCVADY
jgi:hypothetical protein